MKKARTWLESHGVAYEFHDYKVSGIERAKLEAWIEGRSAGRCCSIAPAPHFASCRTRPKANLDEAKAIKLMLEQPSMIKRPVLERGKTLMVGFSPEKYSALK